MDKTMDEKPKLKFGEAVAEYVEGLQWEFTTGRNGSAGILSNLQRAQGKEPGEPGSAWPQTLEVMSEVHVVRGDGPLTPEERAVHAALVLYGVHQKSSPARKHKRGVRLGTAVARASKESQNPDLLLKTFQTVQLTKTFSESSYYLTKLVKLLKDTPLDYGLLTEDLIKLQKDKTRTAVIIGWSRDYTKEFSSRKTKA